MRKYDQRKWDLREPLIRQYAAEGLSQSEMARRLGTNKRQMVREILARKIPYTPFHQGGKNNPRWKGGEILEKGKYVLVKRPDHPQANRHGYVRKHRLVMEAHLGRFLGWTGAWLLFLIGLF